MLAAVNQVIEHDGRSLHINCEDLGFEERAIVVSILSGGGILWKKRMPYQTTAFRSERQRGETEIRAQMAKVVQTVKAAIATGRLP